MRWFIVILIGVASAATLGFTAGASKPRAGESGFEKLLALRAEAIVTIQGVLKTRYEDEDEEDVIELSGVVIDAGGLVLCSASQLGISQASGGSQSLPTALTILVGDDADGRPAKLVAQDSELDLAWLRLKKPPDSPLKAIELSGSIAAQPGDILRTMYRLDRYYDRAPVVSEGRLGGVVHKPRDLLAPSSGIRGDAGLAVFDDENRLVGFFVMQVPESEHAEESADDSTDNLDLLIMPADAVAQATRRALAHESK